MELGWFLDAIKDFLYTALVETWYLGLSLTVIAAYLFQALSEIAVEPKLGKVGGIAFQVLGFVIIFWVAISLLDTNPIFASFMMLLTVAVYWAAHEDEILKKLGIRKKDGKKGAGKKKAAKGSRNQKTSASKEKTPNPKEKTSAPTAADSTKPAACPASALQPEPEDPASSAAQSCRRPPYFQENRK